MENKPNPFYSFKQVLNEGVQKESYYLVTNEGDVVKLGEMSLQEAGNKVTEGCTLMTRSDFKALAEAKKKRPSAGLTKKEKSAVVKKAVAGKDIGKKGKGFEKVADKAAKEYGSKEKGEKVAAAAMWKNIKR